MEKLDKDILFKALCNYLPYELKITFEDGIRHWNIMKCNHLQVFENNDFNKFKPILRPLSDLTKEIDYNGKKYCIMSLWFSVDVNDENDYELLGKVPDYWKTVIKNIDFNGFNHLDYGFLKLLFEHHFDVFGLIKKGLAIDINTLNKQS